MKKIYKIVDSPRGFANETARWYVIAQTETEEAKIKARAEERQELYNSEYSGGWVSWSVVTTGPWLDYFGDVDGDAYFGWLSEPSLAEERGEIK